MQIKKQYAEVILDYEVYATRKGGSPGNYMIKIGLLTELIKEFPDVASKQKYAHLPIVRSRLK